MYESIKYEELKSLPDNQKKEALQQLMSTYGSNSAIAQALETVPITISNMYKKYVEGKPIGRKKGSKNAAKVQEESTNNVTEIKPKRKYTKRTIEDVKTQQESPQQEIVCVPISASFTTSLSGELTGDQIKQRVTGMVNSLLDDNQYIISLQIDEK